MFTTPLASPHLTAAVVADRQHQVATEVAHLRLVRRLRLARKDHRLSAAPGQPRPVERPTVPPTRGRIAGFA